MNPPVTFLNSLNRDGIVYRQIGYMIPLPGERWKKVSWRDEEVSYHSPCVIGQPPRDFARISLSFVGEYLWIPFAVLSILSQSAARSLFPVWEGNDIFVTGGGREVPLSVWPRRTRPTWQIGDSPNYSTSLTNVVLRTRLCLSSAANVLALCKLPSII